MKRFLAAAVISGSLCAANEAGATLFTEQVVHYPGSFYTVVEGINDKGEAVGWYDNGAGSFVFDGTDYRPFTEVAGGTARDINNNGQFIGSYSGGNFFYDGQNTIAVDFPGAASSRVIDLNNNGQVLGTYWTDDYTSHNYLFENGAFSTLELTYNGQELHASGFNDQGDFVGSYSTGPAWHNFQGFIYSDGEFELVDHPFSGEVDATFLQDINNSGQALGGYIDDMLEASNFIYQDGAFTSLPSMYTDRIYVDSINNLGQVSGSFYGPYLGQYEDLDHGFIISPVASSSPAPSKTSVPEPSSMLLFAGTTAAIVGFRRKMA